MAGQLAPGFPEVTATKQTQNFGVRFESCARQIQPKISHLTSPSKVKGLNPQ